MEQPPVPRKRPRGIYLLPNLFTTAALFAGFYAILAATQGRFEASSIAIFAAMLLDGFDGRVARMTHTQTAFGAEYDSLSDMVAFGVAPALVAYHWALGGLGKLVKPDGVLDQLAGIGWRQGLVIGKEVVRAREVGFGFLLYKIPLIGQRPPDVADRREPRDEVAQIRVVRGGGHAVEAPMAGVVGMKQNHVRLDAELL